jgi:hypothetical protein
MLAFPRSCAGILTALRSSPSDRGGCHPEVTKERCSESARTVIADLQGGFGDAHVPATEEVMRHAKAMLSQIPEDARTKERTEWPTRTSYVL